MMKIVASLVILGLCANVAFGAAVTSSSNSGSFSSSLLNSTAITVIKGTNATDSANWDSSCATCGTGSAAVDAGVYNSYTWFGPGTTNDTSYIYGIPTSGVSTATATGSNPGASTPTITTISAIRKRTINNTIVGWGNDTTQASVLSDTSISLSVTGAPTSSAAVGPGYLLLLTTGYDSATSTTPTAQVWVTLISGASGSASTTKVSTATDTFAASASNTAGAVVVCTATSYTLGNAWYDIGSGAFFYTYAKKVQTFGSPTSSGACASTTASTYASTVYLGGIYPNGTSYFTGQISATASSTASSGVSAIVGGGDNWLNATNIYIAYRDTSNTAVYSSKTTKAAATSALGAFSQLVKDPTTTGTTTTVDMTYSPVSVWASNFTYGITVSNTTTTTVVAGPTYSYTYTYVNYLNGTSTGVDSGLSNSAAYSSGTFAGWQLNTGYTVVASWSTGTTSPHPTSYTFATYYANGTANTTATTLGSTTYAAGAQFYEDVNGTMWIGWTDADYAQSNDYTYNAYLAKFQGQLNVPSGASILSALSAFALFLAAIFVF